MNLVQSLNLAMRYPLRPGMAAEQARWFRVGLCVGDADIAAADPREFCEDSLIGTNVTLHPRYHAAPSAIALPPGSPLQRQPRS